MRDNKNSTVFNCRHIIEVDGKKECTGSKDFQSKTSTARSNASHSKWNHSNSFRNRPDYSSLPNSINLGRSKIFASTLQRDQLIAAISCKFDWRDKFLLLTSLIGLTILSNSENWWCDGTFKTALKFYLVFWSLDLVQIWENRTTFGEKIRKKC